MSSLSSDPVEFACGATMKNRFMLAPMTNSQSHEDGCLSDEELNWLSMRAKGGFGLVMTCATHVQESGKGFSGQLGIFSDIHIPGHRRLTDTLRDEGCLSAIQLFHAGMRSPKELTGQAPVCPSDNLKYGARALAADEVIRLRNDFIASAARAKESGYDGVEIHGAHGYIVCQFLSSQLNRRTDDYGGSLENRSRLLFEITDGIRKACGPGFLLGVRLSPERFGMDIDEIKTICQKLIRKGNIDFLHISLWDFNKLPEDGKYQRMSLLSHVTELDYGSVRLVVAGKIRSRADVNKLLDSGVDFVAIGRSAILHHDFPRQVIGNKDFQPVKPPVSVKYLTAEGLSNRFIEYMRNWKGFVEPVNRE